MDADRAAEAGVLGDMKIARNIGDDKLIYNQASNILVENLNPEWNIERLRELFSRFGQIAAIQLNVKTTEEGQQAKAIIEYHEDGDVLHDRQPGQRARANLNENAFDGFKMKIEFAYPKRYHFIDSSLDSDFSLQQDSVKLVVSNLPDNFSFETLKTLLGFESKNLVLKWP